MPANHNHKEWAENKRKRHEQWEQKRDAKRVRFEGDKGDKTKPDGGKRTGKKHPSKLQLSSSLRQSLVTQCSMTPTKADSILDQVFASANGGLKE